MVQKKKTHNAHSFAFSLTGTDKLTNTWATWAYAQSHISICASENMVANQLTGGQTAQTGQRPPECLYV